MRVLLSTVGSRGDVEPVVALAVQLCEQGAAVRVSAPPDDEFARLLDRAGVEHVPLGPSVRSVVAREKPPTVDDAFRFAADLVAARFETLGAAAADCDALLATGLMPAGARSVAEHLGIRYVFACLHVFGLPSRHFPPGARPGVQPSPDDDLALQWKRDSERVNAMYQGPLNEHRAALGLPPVDDVHRHVLTDRALLAADPLLCPWSDMTEIDLVQTGAWILPDERPLPLSLEDFLDAGDPPVYAGFGSMAAYLPSDMASVVIEAVRRQGRRVVVGRGWAELARTDADDDCFVVGEVNQQALFSRVAAVIHHGGAGTTATAARAGAAQVVVPQIADQPWSARRVDELGIGVAHDGRAPTVDSLSEALERALGAQARARETAGKIRADGATVAAKLLLDELD